MSDDPAVTIADQIAETIACSVSPGFELNPDGSEDPTRAAYVEGLRDAWAIALTFAKRRAATGDTA